MVDEVFVVPCGIRSDKVFEIHNRERLELLTKTVYGYFSDALRARIIIDDVEIKHGSMIPTYQLIKMYEKLHPNDTFYFVAGSDLLDSLPSWKLYSKIRTEIRMIIVERKDFEINAERMKNAPENSIFFYSWKSCKVNKSSSMFRNYIKTIKKNEVETKKLGWSQTFLEETTFNHIIDMSLYMTDEVDPSTVTLEEESKI